MAFSATREHLIKFSQKPTILDGNIILTSDLELLNSSNSCELALFFNQKSKVQQLCKAKFLFEPPPALTKLNHSLFMLQNLENYEIECHQNDSEVFNGCHLCLVHLPQKCSLKAAGKYFPPHLYNVETHSVAHLVNLRLLQSFFLKMN